MSTTKFKRGFGLIRVDNMNNSRGVLFLVKTFQNQVVTRRPWVINKVVSAIVWRVIGILCSQNKWVGLLANLALEGFPIVGLEAVAIFDLLFYIQPTSETLKMNITNWTRAFASGKKRIIMSSGCIPTESAPGNFFIRNIFRFHSLKILSGI